MAWILQHEGDKAIIAEIEKQSDRGAIIIAVSFLETRLEQVIKLRLDPTPDPAVTGWMFKGAGPLASLFAKIELGLLMQLYSDATRALLHKLRDLRNDAAHETTPISFTLPSVKARCENLGPLISACGMYEVHHFYRVMTATFEMRAKAKPLSERTPMRSLQDDGSVVEDVWGVAYGDAKSSFLAAVKIVLLHLRQISELFERVQIVLPAPLGKLPPLPGKPAQLPTPQAPSPNPERKEP